LAAAAVCLEGLERAVDGADALAGLVERATPAGVIVCLDQRRAAARRRGAPPSESPGVSLVSEAHDWSRVLWTERDPAARPRVKSSLFASSSRCGAIVGPAFAYL